MVSVELSYYYGYESEQFSFYRIPKLLFTDSRLANLSTDAKLLYGILLDRMSLSMKNGGHDEQGRVYIIFTLEDVGPGTTLEDLRKKHSVEHRPGGGTLRSLCDSDILLVNQGGKQTAYYVEAEKFQELSDSFAAQLPQQDKPEKNKHKHEFER